ncbi:MAG TPA: carboxypeptidase-like regulatory domain-containing protein, partial [Gemmatimonadaceae bacterium]|nr:carboxypeptidase-like regulatory domain-containing protein [Gemmatimonadaceae bacterium]
FSQESVTHDSSGRKLGALAGVVLDSASGSGIPAAQVRLRTSNPPETRYAITSDRGGFIIDRLEPGHYDVLVRRLGFMPFVSHRDVRAGVVDTIVVRIAASTAMLSDARRRIDGTAYLGPKANLVLTRPPDFSARVYSVEFEGGNGPGGHYSQENVWVMIPPGTTANAGVVVPTSSPVFVRTRDGTFSSGASHIRMGDAIDVWHDWTVAHGAVQGPPGAPTYTTTQVVINR